MSISRIRAVRFSEQAHIKMTLLVIKEFMDSLAIICKFLSINFFFQLQRRSLENCLGSFHKKGYFIQDNAGSQTYVTNENHSVT